MACQTRAPRGHRPAAARARRGLRLRAHGRHPALVRRRADHPAARREHPDDSVAALGPRPPHRAPGSRRVRPRRAPAAHRLVPRQHGPRHAPPPRRRRGDDDPDRRGDAAVHGRRRSVEQQARHVARARGRLGIQPRRVSDAARRRAQPARDEVRPGHGHPPRVPVHDLGDAAHAAHDWCRCSHHALHGRCVRFRSRRQRPPARGTFSRNCVLSGR